MLKRDRDRSSELGAGTVIQRKFSRSREATTSDRSDPHKKKHIDYAKANEKQFNLAEEGVDLVSRDQESLP